MKKTFLQKVHDGIKEVGDFLSYLINPKRIRIFPRGLLPRFILIILLPLLLLQVVAAMVFYDHHWSSISRRLANDVAGEIETVIFMLDSFPGSEQTVATIEAMEKPLLFNIDYREGASLDLSLPRQENSSIVSQLVRSLNELKNPFIVTENLDQNYIVVSFQLSGGVLDVLMPKKRFFSSTTYAFVIWMIVASVLLFWIAFLFMKNQVRSVTRLAKAAEDFGTGRGISKFKPEGATEVKQAGQSFLKMRDRLQKYLMERTGMLSGVSHDLRTPLTRMKLQLSMMSDVEGTTDLLADIDEMERMLEGYLAFARGEGKEPAELTEISSLLTETVEKLRRNGHLIDLHIEQTQKMIVRPNDFSRAITNILTNAHRYAQNAYVNMGIRESFLEITIDDDGPGIPEEKRADVFKAFYRLDNSRNTKTGGVGLGLTITRDIVLSHGGEIILSTSPMKGLRVLLRFPI